MRKTRGQPGAVSYRKETELLQHFELQVSERHKLDVFLMFHFKIITMDLFLKKYIKLKLLSHSVYEKDTFGDQLLEVPMCCPYVSICCYGALEAI